MNRKKDKIDKYIKYIKTYLERRFGKFENEWIITLSCLEDCLRRYDEIKESIKVNGIYDPSTGRKNPLLSTEKDCLATIVKLCQKLGVSPYDAAKIRETEEDDSELLKNMMGEDD